MRPGVDFLCQPGVNRQCIAIASNGLERLMRLAVLDDKLKMETLPAFLEISMYQFGGASRIGVAYCAGLDRDGGGSVSQELVGNDPRSDRGDPVETLITRKVFERQKCHALDRIASSGTSGA